MELREGVTQAKGSEYGDIEEGRGAGVQLSEGV